MTDEEAAELPFQLDAIAFERMGITNWRTDAGDLDVMVDMPNREGRRLRYDDLLANARSIDHAGLVIRVAGLDDIIASKEWANRPKDHEALPELYELRERAGTLLDDTTDADDHDEGVSLGL